MPGIIRAAEVKSRIVRAEVWDAKQQAIAIVERAKQQAHELVETARAEADAIKANAVAQGRADGYAEVAQLLLKAQRTFTGALVTAERELIQLAVTSAERIVHEELKLDPARIHAIVTEALQRVRQANQLRVFVHPADKLVLDDLQSNGMLQLQDVCLVEDAELSRGGCVVSSEWGEIDARLETRLELLREALQK